MFSAFLTFQSILRDQPFADSRFGAQVIKTNVRTMLYFYIWWDVAGLHRNVMYDGNTLAQCVHVCGCVFAFYSDAPHAL